MRMTAAKGDQMHCRLLLLLVAFVLPLLALIAFGAIKLMVGLSRDRPVGFLVVLLIATAILAVIRWRAIDRCTRAGRAALARVRQEAERIKAAPTRQEMATAVALFGTAVLAGSAFAPLHTLRAGSSAGSGGCGGGGGDGGGGGGCGGCGS